MRKLMLGFFLVCAVCPAFAQEFEPIVAMHGAPGRSFRITSSVEGNGGNRVYKYLFENRSDQALNVMPISMLQGRILFLAGFFVDHKDPVVSEIEHGKIAFRLDPHETKVFEIPDSSGPMKLFISIMCFDESLGMVSDMRMDVLYIYVPKWPVAFAQDAK